MTASSTRSIKMLLLELSSIGDELGAFAFDDTSLAECRALILAVAHARVAAGCLDHILAEHAAAALTPGRCVVCDCTDERACDGGCAWVLPNLCTRCLGVPGLVALEVASAAPRTGSEQLAATIAEHAARCASPRCGHPRYVHRRGSPHDCLRCACRSFTASQPTRKEG